MLSVCWLWQCCWALPEASLTTVDSHAHPDEAGLSSRVLRDLQPQGDTEAHPVHHAAVTGHGAGMSSTKIWQRSHGNVECRANQPNLGVPTAEWVLLLALMPKHKDLRQQVNTYSHQRAWSIISKEVWMLKQALGTCELLKGL